MESNLKRKNVKTSFFKIWIILNMLENSLKNIERKVKTEENETNLWLLCNCLQKYILLQGYHNHLLFESKIAVDCVHWQYHYCSVQSCKKHNLHYLCYLVETALWHDQVTTFDAWGRKKKRKENKIEERKNTTEKIREETMK